MMARTFSHAVASIDQSSELTPPSSGQEMAQQQYNVIQKAEEFRNAVMQQSGSGLLSKLGFGRWF
jgi:hypothetical protein